VTNKNKTNKNKKKKRKIAHEELQHSTRQTTQNKENNLGIAEEGRVGVALLL
jgi:hypothetical protein